MQYIFILGRNPQLSIAELKAVLGNFNHKQIGNAIMVEIPQLEKGFIDKLGGTIAIGEVFGIDKIDLSKISGTKLNYAVWDFSDGNEFIDEAREILKEKFREEGIKATEKKVANRLKIQSGEEIPNISSNKLVDEQYFVFYDKFGRITQTNDYGEIEKSDMEKPVRRESLAISPRLAKIMLNLSKTGEGGTIVDPFCGIGVIIQEALKQKISVIGIDKDAKAIDGLKKNLDWLKIRNNYRLIVGNSAQVKIGKASALVTEPDFGETLKHMPNENEAKEIIFNYEKLIISVINNLKTQISGRLVFTAPFILSKSAGKVRRIGCSREKILSSTKLHIVSGFPIEEFRENQVVGRQIFVLEH